MPFTQAELDNITNSVIDYHIRSSALDQIKQNRPLLAMLEARAKTMPGGKGDITKGVRGQYFTTVEGYSTDDTVSYVNPTPTVRVRYPWREHHSGIKATLTELKHDGVTVDDTLASKTTREMKRRDTVVLTGLLDEKIYDMTEGYAVGMQQLSWGDGVADPQALAGVQSIIRDIPVVGTVGGINAANVTWWRNRAATTAWAGHVPAGQGPITANPANGGALLQFMSKELRQLRRYGGRPIGWFAGADFIDAMETELRANGNYTDSGFMRKEAVDGGMAELYYKGNKIEYDPYLDDLGRAKFMYVIDPRRLCFYDMEGEVMKRHSPARPPEQYVMFRAITTTRQMFCDHRTCHGVYEIT